jgi:hypothetical protein
MSKLDMELRLEIVALKGRNTSAMGEAHGIKEMEVPILAVKERDTEPPRLCISPFQG